MTAPPSPNNFDSSPTANGVDLSWTYDNVWFGFDGDDGAISGFDEGRWLHPDNGIYIYYRKKGDSSFSQYSEASIDANSESLTTLESDTTYEFKIEVYNGGNSSETNILETRTYLDDTRLVDSHSPINSTSSIRVVDLIDQVSSYGATTTSSSIRNTDVLKTVTSTSSPIGSNILTQINLDQTVTSSSDIIDSSTIRVVDLFEAIESHSISSSSDNIRIIDSFEGVSSNAKSMLSTVTRNGITYEGRNSDTSYSVINNSSAIRNIDYDKLVSSHGRISDSYSSRVVDLLENVTSSSTPIRGESGRVIDVFEDVTSTSSPINSSTIRIIDLLENVNSHSIEKNTEAYRSQIAFETRESEPSITSIASSDNSRLISLLQKPESYLSECRGYNYTQRVSLEVIDQKVLWNENDSYWYTNWFEETRIVGSEDTLAIRSLVVDNAKEPAAIVTVEYDSDGDGEVDSVSEPIKLGRNEQVEEIHGIPVSEEGQYRIKITEYSGYNSLYKLDLAIVH